MKRRSTRPSFRRTSLRKSAARRMAPLTAVPRRSGPEVEAEVRGVARTRVNVSLGFVVVAMAALFARAGYVMTIPNEYIEEHGVALYQAPVDITGGRGALVDREGRLLAWTVELPTLYVNASKFPQDEVKARAPAIAAATGRTVEDVEKRLTNAGSRHFELGSGLDPAVAKELTRGLERDQLWTLDEPLRLYPGKESAAPLLGFVDGSGRGAAGLERVLDGRLAGQTYTMMRARDRKDRSVDATVDQARLEKPGKTVRLTIDQSIQDAAEAALDQVMAEALPESATAVVVDIDSGAVLAVANRPTGNPNDGAARADLSLFKNHAAMDQVEPGSVMKPFVVAAALEEGIATPDTLVDCELGRWPVSDRIIKDDHAKGVISVTEIIKYSSNIGTAKLAFKLGAERTLAYLTAFGFSRPTGLGLPGEVRGQMRKADDIRPIELATTAFGQGVTASPVQLAVGVAAIANGGVRMQPYLVDAILDRRGQIEESTDPREDRRVVSEETARAITRMMESVIEEGGTGTRARVPGYRVAGKTGTAQKVENGLYSPTKRVSSFVGFLPSDRPEVAIVVVVDSPTRGSRYGGIVAAPAFASIGAFAMRYLGVAPDPTLLEVDAPHSTPAESDEVGPIELVADAGGRWVLPDLRGRSMRSTLEALAPAGLALNIQGYGRLVGQSPAPGEPVAPGAPVSLVFD